MKKITLIEKINQTGLRIVACINNLPSPGSLETGPIVLCYHSIENDSWRFSVSVAEFKKQMQFLKRTKTVLPLSEIVKAKKKLKNTVALTFDDGYKNNLLNATPILSELGLPATLFVLGDSKKADRKALGNKKELLSASEIKKLHKMGWEIGFHSDTHTNLWKLTDQELEEEIVKSKKRKEKELGITLRYFAYPMGLYSEKIIALVKKAGFEAAFTVDGGASYAKDKMKIARTCVESTMKGGSFEAVVSVLGLSFQSFLMLGLRLKERARFLLKK